MSAIKRSELPVRMFGVMDWDSGFFWRVAGRLTEEEAMEAADHNLGLEGITWFTLSINLYPEDGFDVEDGVHTGMCMLQERSNGNFQAYGWNWDKRLDDEICLK